jgi:Ycf66 protein N-terminus
MLAYVLAIAIGLISIIFFLAAFFAPKVHRQDDFLWSGVGLFYALVLWVCAERITGAILLGQTAATLLLLAYGAETINLRGAIANPDKIPAMKSFSVSSWLLSSLGGLFSLFRKPKVKLENTTVRETILEKDRVTEIEPTTSEISKLETEVESQTAELSVSDREEVEQEKVEEAIAEELEAVTEELKQTASASSPQSKTAKQGNIFSGLLGKINNPFSRNKAQQTGLTAAPILETDEDFEEKSAETVSESKEIEASTSESIAETVSEESKTISEVVPEVSQEIVEKVETTITSSDDRTVMETKIEVEATETVVFDNQNLKPEQNIPEESPETIFPQNTPPVTESDAPKPESNSPEKAIDVPETPTNDLQKRSDVNEEKETQTDSSSDFKAEIAKIFEEDEKK